LKRDKREIFSEGVSMNRPRRSAMTTYQWAQCV